MKKRKLLNICMVMTILITVICGIMAVGSVKGWFSEKENQTAEYTVSEKSGIAMIERSGIAYEVSSGTVIRPEDHLYTKNGAALTIANAEKNIIYLNGHIEIQVNDTESGFSFEACKGEILTDARALNGICGSFGENEIVLDDAVTMISAQTGSTMISVYSGKITIKTSEETEAFEVTSGNVATILENGKSTSVEKLTAAALNDVQIRQLLSLAPDESFCFTKAELKQVQEAREAEILEAQQESLKLQEQEEEQENAPSNSKEASEAAEQTEKEDKTSEEKEAAKEPEDSSSGNEVSENAKTCTIKIVCDTILDNMGNLEAGKEAYVPSNGVILGSVSVEFSEGETVFDVLQRVCSSTGIQLEYSYTPIYESYYIEGINHLYEFDCGNESGWMYKVNGWFPNYGCSSYYLEDGDTIVWCYTCNGLGADVGGAVY